MDGLVDHPGQGDMAGRIFLLLLRFGPPSTPDITVVTGEIHFFQIRRRIVLTLRLGRIRLFHLFVANRPSPLHPSLMRKQHGLELDPPLVDTHSVSGDHRTRLASMPVRRALKLRNAVHGIEQAEEIHPIDGPTHSLTTEPQTIIRLHPARMRLGREFPVRKRLPDKGDQLFIIGADQPDIVEHLVEEPSRVCAAGEAEQVNLGTGFPPSGQEPIPADDMLIEGGGQGQVEGFLRRQFVGWSEGEVGEGAGRDFGSYAGYFHLALIYIS